MDHFAWLPGWVITGLTTFGSAAVLGTCWLLAGMCKKLGARVRLIGEKIVKAADDVGDIKMSLTTFDDRLLGVEALQAGMIASDKDIGFYCDKNGELNRVTHGFTRITGLDLAGAKDGGARRAIHPDDLDRVLRAWGECVRTGHMFVCDFRYMHIHTKLTTHCHVEAQATKFADRIVGWAGRVEIETQDEAPDPEFVKQMDELDKK